MKTNFSIAPQVLGADPQLALRLIRVFGRQYRAIQVHRNLEVLRPKRIALVTFRLTPLCNLHCVMCGQNGESGTFGAQRQAEERTNVVPLARYARLAEELSVHDPVLYIWGGEPFLYPDFLEFTRTMVEKCPLLAVNTNGTWLEENAAEIVRQKWAGIFVSMDGPRDVNDAMRGKGTFDRVIRGMQAINREKERQNSSRPYMGVVSTVTRLNWEHLDGHALSLRDQKLAWHIINLGTYITEALGEKHRAEMKKVMGVDPLYWKGFASGFNEGIDGRRFNEILRRVHALDNGYPIITVPVIRPDKIDTYYSDLDTLVRDRCSAPWFSLNLNYNGDVHFCADYPDYVLGNLMDQGIDEIFRGPRATAFRQALTEAPDGVFSGCHRCYQLMLCGRRREGF